MQRVRPDPGEATEALVNLLAERIATHLAEKLEGPNAAAGREVMNAAEAADFLRLSLPEFRRQARNLPRHAITNSAHPRYVYLREDLLEWLRSR